MNLVFSINDPKTTVDLIMHKATSQQTLNVIIKGKNGNKWIIWVHNCSKQALRDKIENAISVLSDPDDHVGCTNCINCMEIAYCTNCTDCTNCVDCYQCVQCDECAGCYNIVACNDCKRCAGLCGEFSQVDKYVG